MWTIRVSGKRLPMTEKEKELMKKDEIQDLASGAISESIGLMNVGPRQI